MSAGSDWRDLSKPLDSAAAWPGQSKMAAGITRGTACEVEESIADQDQAAFSATHQETATVSMPQQVAPSSASMESLLGRSLGGPVLTALQELLTSPDPWEQEAHDTTLTPSDFPSMMAAFS